MSAPIPVSVIGGYLGAGKTTLVNHLLRHAGGRRLAVLVNDFGELPIDDALIEARDGNLLRLAGGCVCCSFGSDLLGALQQLSALSPPPQQLLLECSGVARPGAVARTLTLLPALQRDAVLVLADAESLRERAADRYVGELVQQQLAEADLIALNKCDRIDAATLPGCCRAPRAACHPSCCSALAPRREPAPPARRTTRRRPLPASRSSSPTRWTRSGWPGH
ncbi:MAG: GTP-binding protein [Burkholderiales bacterium]|nr:GTP-binding protein [Burkholderiales bacterium]